MLQNIVYGEAGLPKGQKMNAKPTHLLTLGVLLMCPMFTKSF